MTLVYIAIGSNLASPLEQVTLPSTRWRNSAQPRGAVSSSTARRRWARRISLTTSTPPSRWKPPCPEALLDHTQRIELQQGRVRKAERWGPRTLDLDIMLFGDAVINSERLTVPHYDMKNRGFMLWPLFEIAPSSIS
jgi:2-amino-4-hydroxy-6-hydroxymethyldihydropteridine diphosphokinase